MIKFPRQKYAFLTRHTTVQRNCQSTMRINAKNTQPGTQPGTPGHRAATWARWCVWRPSRPRHERPHEACAARGYHKRTTTYYEKVWCTKDCWKTAFLPRRNSTLRKICSQWHLLPQRNGTLPEVENWKWTWENFDSDVVIWESCTWLFCLYETSHCGRTYGKFTISLQQNHQLRKMLLRQLNIMI